MKHRCFNRKHEIIKTSKTTTTSEPSHQRANIVVNLTTDEAKNSKILNWTHRPMIRINVIFQILEFSYPVAHIRHLV